MILTFKQAVEKYGSKYNLKKCIENKELYKIDKGYYSDTEYYSKLEYIVLKYPKIIFTYQSAFFYLGFSDYIPNVYYIATKNNSKRVPLKEIKQTYENEGYYGLGSKTVNMHGIDIKIYDKERMLIELMRHHNKIPFDYYKEIIQVYRKKLDELNMDKLMKYLVVFHNHEFILEKLNKEVF